MLTVLSSPFPPSSSDEDEDEIQSLEEESITMFLQYKHLHDTLLELPPKGDDGFHSVFNSYKAFPEKDGLDERVQAICDILQALRPYKKEGDFLKAMVVVVDVGSLVQADDRHRYWDEIQEKITFGIVRTEEDLVTTGTTHILAKPDPRMLAKSRRYSCWRVCCVPADLLSQLVPDRCRILYPADDDDDGIHVRLNNCGVAYSWSPLFWTTLSAKHRFFLLHALIGAQREASVFMTCAGASFEQDAWYRVSRRFWLSMSRDVLTIVFLLYIGYCVRGGKQPERWVFTFVLLMSILSVAGIAIEFLVTTCLYRKKDRCSFRLLGRYLGGWQILFTALEVFTFAMFAHVVRRMGDTVEHNESCDIRSDYDKKNCWYLKNPVLLMFVVFGKCMFFTIKALCFRPFGEQVYCAYATLISPEQVAFSMFLAMLLMSSVFAYYMLPIEENMADAHVLGNATISPVLTKMDVTGLHPLFRTFMKVFRLQYMGDFDLYELEGIDPVLNANKEWTDPSLNSSHESVTVAELDDGETNPQYHFGVSLFFVIGAFIHLVILNVYIGLVSNVYNKLYAYRFQIFAEFRAVFSAKELIWDYLIFDRCFRCQGLRDCFQRSRDIIAGDFEPTQEMAVLAVSKAGPKMDEFGWNAQNAGSASPMRYQLPIFK